MNAASRAATTSELPLLVRLAEARARTDALFQVLPPNSFYDRPIAERHRLIFYLGHLEAFDFNLLAGPLDLASHRRSLQQIIRFRDRSG